MVLALCGATRTPPLHYEIQMQMGNHSLPWYTFVMDVKTIGHS